MHNTLQQIVIETINSHPEGIGHAQLVRCLLQTGYQHSGNLSADLMEIVRTLTRQGIIRKNLETREMTPTCVLQEQQAG